MRAVLSYLAGRTNSVRNTNTNAQRVHRRNTTGNARPRHVARENIRNPPVETVFFDEGDGYFLVRTLGSGVDGSASLVRSRWNGELYVRKEDLYTHSTPEDRNYALTTPHETANALTVQHIPGVYQAHGWTRWTYEDAPQAFDVTYWKYYNLGALGDFVKKARRADRPVPNSWIASWAVRMMDTLVDIHDAGIVHNDCHSGNWFVETVAPGVPSIVLGDFGRSERQTRLSRSEWINRCAQDFAIALGAICKSLDLQYDEYSGTIYQPDNNTTSNAMCAALTRLAGIPLTRWPCVNTLHEYVVDVRNDIRRTYSQGLHNAASYPNPVAPAVPRFITGEAIERDVRQNRSAFKQWHVAFVSSDEITMRRPRHLIRMEGCAGAWYEFVRGRRPRWTTNADD